MAINYENQAEIKDLIDESLGEENVQRMASSYKEFECFMDRQEQYVYDKLIDSINNEATVRQMPKISSINIARRVVKQESTLYKEPPERQFASDKSTLSDGQENALQMMYDDGNFNVKLAKSNAFFKLQNQNIFQVLPMYGKLQIRPLLRHHVNVVPDSKNPEMPEAYFIGGFDRTRFVAGNKNMDYTKSQYRQPYQDFRNQKIADADDWRKKARFVWWTKELNFITNGMGEILPDENMGANGLIDIESPIVGHLPFVDVAPAKDFEFWVRQGQSLTDFSIEYNAYMSIIMDIIRMQGFAVPVFTGSDDLLPEYVTIGPRQGIRLPQDPDNPTTFSFESPSPDIGASIQFGEFLLANFLSSRGIDPKTISGKAESNKFNSGIERLLSMIEQFSASKDDQNNYDSAEQELVKLVGVWHNNLKGDETQLDKKYWTDDFPDDLYVSVNFYKPEMIQTESEKLANIETKMRLGLMSKVDALSVIENIEPDQARERIAEISAEKQEMIAKQLSATITMPPSNNGDSDDNSDGEGDGQV